MKKEITKYISSIEEVSIEEAVNEFFEGDWEPRSWGYTESYIDYYIETEFKETSDEEKNLLKAEIKKEFDKKVNEIRQKEIDKLKDRNSILNWIDRSIECTDPDEEEIGYILSEEKILDLILENGNK